MLPQFSLSAVMTHWQFAPIVTAVVAVAAGLYGWGVIRVAQRHPARPWPLWRTCMFLGGIVVLVLATQSGIGAYDDLLFYDHMIQHLMLLMVVPPLLIAGQPLTLLLHASRNPLHSWTKRLLRSRLASFLTWPVFGAVTYAVAVMAAHLTSIANYVERNPTAHDAEHGLFVLVGYLFFLPILGKEPIRWRLSYPVRFVALILLMPVDTFTGLELGYGSGSSPGVPGRPEARLGAVAGLGSAPGRRGDVDRRRRDHVRPDDARVPDVEPGRTGRRQRSRLLRARQAGESRHPDRLEPTAPWRGRWGRIRCGRCFWDRDQRPGPGQSRRWRGPGIR